MNKVIKILWWFIVFPFLLMLIGFVIISKINSANFKTSSYFPNEPTT